MSFDVTVRVAGRRFGLTARSEKGRSFIGRNLGVVPAIGHELVVAAPRELVQGMLDAGLRVEMTRRRATRA